MALKTQLSFSSGELDPALHDNVTLQKFNKGLETARNVMIGKTGSILSRFPTAHFIPAKNNNEKIKLCSPPNSGVVTEWGVDYVRLYNFSGTLLHEATGTGYTEDDLDKMHFVPAKNFIFVFVEGTLTERYRYTTPYSFGGFQSYFNIPDNPTGASVTKVGPPSGYQVIYGASGVYNGEESTVQLLNFSPNANKPVVSGHQNNLTINLNAHTDNEGNVIAPSEVRIYRRPADGGAFGFLGSTTDITLVSGIAYTANFTDLGGNADFTNQPILPVTSDGLLSQNPNTINGKTGCIYQQRLLTTSSNDKEAIIASRPGFKNNFYRDFPYDADSALKFKSGTTGEAEVLRMIDNDGLIVFTTIGVYTSLGLLSIDNVALEKKGAWVIDEDIPPLSVPGGVFFVDKLTNSIKQLLYSRDSLTYQSIDHTIFSNHLFREKKIKSWCYQEGVSPLIIVTFNDGTMATFTYHLEHQMKAWTRHDLTYDVEQVEGTGTSDTSFLVVNKNGQRYINVTLPRFVPGDVYVDNPEADKLNFNCFADAVKTQSILLNDLQALSGEAWRFVINGSDFEDAEGVYQLESTNGSSSSPVFLPMSEGDVIRWFNPDDRTFIDFKIVSKVSNFYVFVHAYEPIPDKYLGGSVNTRLYQTQNQVTGLDHLEGEEVVIYSDGSVLSSPFNDVDGLTPVTVSGGSVTLPNDELGAIIIVGRPIAADIKTLNVSTVSQSPTIIESLNLNKLYMRVHNTRGLYVSNEFPEEASGQKDGTSVRGMRDLNFHDVPRGGIVGNTYKQPVSKRHEISVPGKWNSQGRISIRQVDPLHFEILSIIPDLEVLNRSNR